VSRVCEEFGCVPSVAAREVLRLPAGLLEDMIELRAYKRAKDLYDAADTAAKQQALPASPLIDLVREVDFSLADEALKRNVRG